MKLRHLIVLPIILSSSVAAQEPAGTELPPGCEPYTCDCPLLPKPFFCITDEQKAIESFCGPENYDCDKCPLQPKMAFCPGALAQTQGVISAPPLFGCESAPECCDLVSNPDPPASCYGELTEGDMQDVKNGFPESARPYVAEILSGDKQTAIQHYRSAARHIDSLKESEAAAWREFFNAQESYFNLLKEVR